MCPKCICFFWELLRVWVIGNRRLSLLIPIEKKSNSRLAIVRFCLLLVWLQTELDSTQPITKSNHNHYNFLKCDWCICCFIFHYSFCTIVIGQLAVIGQLKQPIILGPFSWIHRSQNWSQQPWQQPFIQRKTRQFPKWRNIKLKTLSALERFVLGVFVFSEIEMVMINW